MLFYTAKKYDQSTIQFDKFKQYYINQMRKRWWLTAFAVYSDPTEIDGHCEKKKREKKKKPT